MSESVRRQVQGKCEGAMMKADGWVEYHIGIGRQYPVKLATKKDDVKLLAAAAGTNDAIWTFNESQGNPNPHRPGEFFKNRYLESVEVGGTLDPALAGQPGQQTLPNAPTPGGIRTGEMPDERGRSIEKQVILKAALPHYPPGLIADDAQFFEFLDRLDAWMVGEPVVETPLPEPEPQTTTETPAGQGGEDDDIPF